MKYFKFYNKQDILSVTNTRRFETKLGERLQAISDPKRLEESLKESEAKFVIFGVPEDIGVRANFGMGGTGTAWQPFLSSFVNIQSNDFLEGSEILLLGRFDFTEIEALIESNAHNFEEKVDAYRHAVNEVDEAVEPLVKLITQYNKIPIVIGGGHNNAYPLIKGAAKGLYKSGLIPLASINCINLDAHADFRPLEGRHSGNAFSYAEEDGFLQKYCVIGIHENYLTQNIWMDVVNNPFIDFITYEDIFIHEKKNFLEAIAHATTFTEDTYTGIELDLDCIENTLSSAATPSGVEPLHARQFISYASADSKTAYLHICEGASRLSDGRSSETTGKLIAYLVSDFLKAKE
ncbi:formimidoylglutamase [Segetibacter sp.]|jgi:formiminoglutamase|uniref:formimidoylglutamase n=1 Tax=Segetibacter sp. TaxID=2231182 RepID=UPI00260A7825|nr:formimidoylglutamase [Segetibacter sp.]MCW3081002.1 Arginase/agmatinase/formiminoglutamase [Segetibacter sp.]